MRPRLLGAAVAVLSATSAAAGQMQLPPTSSPPPLTLPAFPIPPAPGTPTTQPAPATHPKVEVPTDPPVAPTPRSRSDAPITPPQVPPEVVPGPTPGLPVNPVPEACAPNGPGAAPAFCDDHLGPWNTVWVRGGYAMYWIKSAPPSPPLVSSGLLGGGGRILAGNSDVGYGRFDGLTLDGGMWLNERHTFGVGLAGFITGKQTTTATFVADPAGAPLIARPFSNPLLVNLGGEDAFLVSAPGRYTGAVTVENGARIAGTEVNLLLNLTNTERLTVTGVTGFRYFDLDEYLTVDQTTRGLNGNTIPFFGAPGGVPVVNITDRFRTRNQFFGGQIGADAELRFGPGFFDVGSKIGFGPVHQVTEVNGQTVAPGGPGGPGGVLAVGSIPNGNIGRTVTNRFSVLADAHAMLGIQVANRLRVGVGYQFLYLDNVARPGRQVVSTIDPRIVPSAAAFGGRAPSNTALGGTGTPPLSPFDRDGFFAHGLQFLAEFQY